MLPIVNGSLEKLETINPETQEVKEIKEKYVKVIGVYQNGFEALIEGCKTQKEETINAGNESIAKALELLDEYNGALEVLAAEHGGEIEY